MLAKCWKNLKLCINKLKLDFKLLPKICFRRNNIHWEIDQWNRRRFGAKWHVTVPNSVAPVRPIVYKWIYMSQGSCCQMTHKLHVCQISIRSLVELWFWAIFIKFLSKNAVFCRLAQQELKVSYETSTFWSMFMLPKYWWKQLYWRNGIRY